MLIDELKGGGIVNVENPITTNANAVRWNLNSIGIPVLAAEFVGRFKTADMNDIIRERKRKKETTPETSVTIFETDED